MLTTVLVVAFWVHWRGFAGSPGLINSDEGIYMQQAWAVQYKHFSLSPYTFMYDHPPFGWITIAAYTTVTRAFQRDPTAIIAGREAMLFIHLVTVLFLYLLARRLGLRQFFAGAAVLLFSLSPLALEFQRFVFLDNVAVMWAVIGLWALASPMRSLRSAATAGVACALAVLSKETIFVALILGVFIMLWDRSDDRNAKIWRSYMRWSFALTAAFYVLYAVVKNEFIPGRGHVSLLGSAWWQLVGRQGSGSVLDPHSGKYMAVIGWLHADPVLLGVGTLAIPAALLIKRLRGVAVCLLAQVLFLGTKGYLPFAYATAMFPFAALVIAGVADRIWTLVWRTPQEGTRADQWLWRKPAITGLARLAVVGLMALAAVSLTHRWGPSLHEAMSAKPDYAVRDAAQYVMQHVPAKALLVVDDDVWTDLRMQGREAVPTFKLDLDPALHRKLNGQGYHGIGYLLLTRYDNQERMIQENLPTVKEALDHSQVVRKFGNGSLILWRVSG